MERLRLGGGGQAHHHHGQRTMIRFALALLLALWLGAPTAQAQNANCPDVPAGDSSNRCANTRFVKGAVPVGIPYLNITGVPAHSFLGNNTGSPANAIAMTQTQATAELNPCTSALQGLVPAPPNDTTKFLRGDCAFAVPPGGTGNRILLLANTTYFVRTTPVAVTITNASPAVVTHTAHGYLAGQLVTFNSTATLPTGLTAGTVYCVIAAGLATNTYQVSATCGGAAVNTSSAGSGTFTEQAGNDASGTGISATPTVAFITLQGAIKYLQQSIDPGNFKVTVKAACAGGGGVALYGNTSVNMPLIGGNQATNTPSVIIEGDTTTPSNCLAQDLGAIGSVFAVEQNANVQIQGFLISSTTPGGYGILSDTGANLWLGNMTYGAMSGGGNPAHINAHAGGRAFCLTSYSVTGTSGFHWSIERGGFLECAGITITITGTPNFTGAFAYADNGGQIYSPGVTFSGSATGVRYFAQYMGSIHTLSASTTYFPGNSAGTPAVNTFATSGVSCCGHYNYLLKRDILPGPVNDNAPMWLDEAA
jgi:hypothetical protein